jgi:hypothetical protein
MVPHLTTTQVVAENRQSFTVSDCKQKAQHFVQHLSDISSEQAVTYYMHFLHDHLWQWTEVYLEEFGFGYGVLSTQVMEHCLKLFK